MAVLAVARALGSAWLVGLAGCVPGELFLEAPGEGGADSTHARDAGADAPRRDGNGEVDVAGGDTGAGDTGAGDTGADTGGGDTGGADAADGGSCPTPADCANPACKAQGYVCTPPPPTAVWTVASVDFTGKGKTCPPGYGSSMALVTAPTGGPASCGCSCSLGAAPSCVQGTIDLMYGLSTTCTMSITADANDGGCKSGPSLVPPAVQITSTPPPTGGTCNGSPSMTLPPSGSTSASVCSWTGALSATGCAGGDVCVATTTGQTQCVLAPGTLACAGPYGASHPVGASVSDSRACKGACACAAPTATCTAETWSFYSSTDCSGTGVPADLDGGCNPTSGGSYSSSQYSATVVGADCGAPTGVPKPVGALSLVSPSTLCCLP